MPRDPHAQIAVDEFLSLVRKNGWGSADAWKGVVTLLLSCDVWSDGFRRLGTLRKHNGVPDCVIWCERDKFNFNSDGVTPNATLRRGLQLTDYLAEQLGVARADLCDSIGRHFMHPALNNLQPNNTRGHAFRSLVCIALQLFGDPDLVYEEEVDIHAEFPGHRFETRSADSKLDILARRDGIPVALISVRWALRHDRIDVVEEALAYGPAARRLNRNCRLYGVVGEFMPIRLVKALDHCPPHPNPALDALIHFNPDLIRNGLGVNGTIAQLQSLEWLIGESHSWR